MKKTTSLVAIFVSIASFLFYGLQNSPAEAATWRTCNGSPVIWRGTLNVHRNRCSIPDTGIVNLAYWNAVGQWNSLSNVVDNFFVNRADDCTYRSGDGQNEVGLANRSDIDGFNGVAFVRIGLCFIGSNDIDEVDIAIANDLNFTVRPGNFRGTSGRSTFVHEFGHFFGFLHEGGHVVMRTSPPHLITGGFESSTVWPNDTIGMFRLYGFSTSRSRRANLLPSALGVVGTTVQRLDSLSTQTRCRGDTTSTRVYLGNYGSARTGVYSLRVRLNESAPFDDGYNSNTTVVQTFTHSLPAYGAGTFDLGFTIPSSLPNGIYNIYVDMDYPRDISEVREGDNTTVSAKRIRIAC